MRLQFRMLLRLSYRLRGRTCANARAYELCGSILARGRPEVLLTTLLEFLLKCKFPSQLRQGAETGIAGGSATLD